MVPNILTHSNSWPIFQTSQKSEKKNKSSWNMPILHEILRIRAERCDYVPKSEKTQKSKRLMIPNSLKVP